MEKPSRVVYEEDVIRLSTRFGNGKVEKRCSPFSFYLLFTEYPTVTMNLISQGNGNILIAYSADDQKLYRCCIRYPDSLEKNNRFTLQNYDFIQTTVRPLLGGLLCPMELCELPLVKAGQVYTAYITDPNCIDNLTRNDRNINIYALRLPNLRPGSVYTTLLQEDHFTKLYTNDKRTQILLEIKPKWLYNGNAYCRNCTHNRLKGRQIEYCYTQLLLDPQHYFVNHILSKSSVSNLPESYLSSLSEYFTRQDNVLAKLYDLQKSLYRDKFSQLRAIEDVDAKLQLLMTLRDVTCFIVWDASVKQGRDLDVYVVDVDLKPKEKWKHWVDTWNELNSYEEKCFH